MLFKRPVEIKYPISGTYGQWGPLWSKHMNENGFWVTGQVAGKGQHKGVDFACPEGTLVHAMADGICIVSGWENPSNPRQGFGQRVRQQIITENGTVMTLVYGHLSYIYAQSGQQLVKGDRIGISGKTGHVSGPHLHVELVDARAQYHPIELDKDDIPA